MAEKDEDNFDRSTNHDYLDFLKYLTFLKIHQQIFIFFHMALEKQIALMDRLF